MIELTVGLMSLFLGVFAIWLSIKLYRMSEAGARHMREAQAAVQQSVDQLDRLFERMYSDTWSLVRDSYERMHQQLWEQARTGAGGIVPGQRQRASALRPAGGDPSGRIASPGTAAAREPSSVDDVILDSYHRLSRANAVVRAGDLAAVATRQGYPPVVVLDALYDLAIVQRRLLLAGDRFVPESVVAETPEGLREALRIAGGPPLESDRDEGGGR